MSSKSIWPVVVFVAATAALTGHWVGKRERGGSEPALPASAQPALERLLTAGFKTLDGKAKTLAEWRGSVLVVNFWAAWCPPCRAEMPGFSRLSEQFVAKGVKFAGVAVDDEGAIRAFIKEKPVSYPILLADVEALSLTAALGNGTQGLPFTIIIDRSGKVASVKVGAMGEAELESKLIALSAPQ